MSTITLNDGTVSAPSLSFISDTHLGMYRIGANQMGFTVNSILSYEVGNFVVANLNPLGAQNVRYSTRAFPQALGSGAVETAALYMRLDHSATQNQLGIYGEIDSSQSHTGGSFLKLIHNGAGDGLYVAQFGSGGCVGYEAASWVDGSTGFLADVQVASLPNSILFNALWQQSTIPNYGLFVATDSPGHSLTISKLTGSNEGQVQIRITEPAYSYNRFEVYNSGQVNQIGLASTSLTTLHNSPEHRLVATYWNGSQSVTRHALLVHQMVDTSPSSQLLLKIGPNGSESTVCLFKPGHVDLQNSVIDACGGLTMHAGGGSVDLQGGAVVNVANLQTLAASHQFDMYVGGSNVMTVSDGNSMNNGDLALVILRNKAGSFVMQRCSTGVDDSGGTGYRQVLVPN